MSSAAAALDRTLSVRGAVAPAHIVLAAALVPLASLGFANGGYYPAAWGWGAIVYAWIGVLAVVLRARIALGRLELATLAGLVGLVAWIGASYAWSEAPPASVEEVQRTLLYVAAVAAVLLVVRRRTAPVLLAGVLAAIVLVCGWSLLTRLLPDRLGTFDPLAGYRLNEPLGYWNGLGGLAALGTLLALGFATRAARPAGRAAAAALLPVLLPTVYFTFGRSAWIALGVALVVAVALDPRRLQLATVTPAILLPGLAAVWLASRSEALGTQTAVLADATRDGRRLLAAVAALALVAAALASLAAWLELRVRPAPAVRRAYAAALLSAVAAGLLVTFSLYGPPHEVASRAYHTFTTQPPVTGPDLRQRLFSFSANGRTLVSGVAWDEARAHPLLGTGAGSFERAWLRERPRPFKVLDAHSLYVETLAELGAVGLALLALALGAPLVAAARARHSPLVPAAAAAYVAYLVHAGADWDWELPAVTLAALLTGCALLAFARGEAGRPLAARVRVGSAAALGALALAALGGLVGHLSLAESVDAAAGQDWAESERWARRAERWAPWSAQPWRRIGLAQTTAVKARPYLERAVRLDPGDWELWLELGWASRGPAQTRALAEAERLNPLSREVAEYRAYLEESA